MPAYSFYHINYFNICFKNYFLLVDISAVCFWVCVHAHAHTAVRIAKIDDNQIS